MIDVWFVATVMEIHKVILLKIKRAKNSTLRSLRSVNSLFIPFCVCLASFSPIFILPIHTHSPSLSLYLVSLSLPFFPPPSPPPPFPPNLPSIPPWIPLESGDIEFLMFAVPEVGGVFPEWGWWVYLSGGIVWDQLGKYWGGASIAREELDRERGR